MVALLKTHIISSTGVDAAYLEPGEECISLDHTFCSLIVLSNGRKTFVTHQSAPFEDLLIPQLQLIKKAMGPDTKLTLCVNPDRMSETSKNQYTHIVNYVMGIGAPYDLQAHGDGSYHIASTGVVTFLGKERDPLFIAAEERFGGHLRTAHLLQPIAGESREGVTSVFRYSDMPTFVNEFTDAVAQESTLYSSQFKAGNISDSWNKEVAQRQSILPGDKPLSTVNGTGGVDTPIPPKGRESSGRSWLFGR